MIKENTIKNIVLKNRVIAAPIVTNSLDDNDTAYFAPYSKAMRNAMYKYDIPVDCTGGIRSLETAEKLLKEKVCDLIGIGRPLLSDKSFLSGWNL